MQKADSNSSAGTGADSSTKVEDIFGSSHDTKPHVSGLPSSTNEKGLAAHMICNPERPYQEYVIVRPEEYREHLTYSDYLKIYKPIVVAELETTLIGDKV